MNGLSSRLTAANYYVSHFYQLAVDNGLDADAMLDRCGIPGALVTSPEQRVPADKLAGIVRFLWDELNDESMGLSAGGIPRGSIELMAKLGLIETSLGAALTEACRFTNMVTTAYRVEIFRAGPVSELRIALADPHLDDAHLLAELLLLLWHRFSCWLIGENIAMKYVSFDYPSPTHAAEYRYLFPGQCRFSRSTLGYRFDSRYLERRIVQTHNTLDSFISRCPVELFLKPRTDFSLAGEVRQLISECIEDGVLTIDQAAVRLHMARRTLIRRLEAEQTSFQAIKDEVRHAMAVDLLAQPALDIAEVAHRVGFSDAAVFSRAFKGWTGQSPSGFRSSRR